MARREQVCVKSEKKQVGARSIIPNKGQGGACPHTYVLSRITLQRRQSYNKRRSCKQGKYTFPSMLTCQMHDQL